jgi:Tfp pilus assembly protein PilF
LWQASAALRNAAFGNTADAQKEAAAALNLAPESPGVLIEATLTFALIGDNARAQALSKDLSARFPLDTQMQSLWLPIIGARTALNQKNAATAISLLERAKPMDMAMIPFTANTSCLYAPYVRGQAYLAAGQGEAAAAEFQKILDHNGLVWNCWTGALAHLGVARAYALEWKTTQAANAEAARTQARTTYNDFFTLWKDADPEIPVLKQAIAEYAKLQ